MTITPEQIRAARAILGMDQRRLAAFAGVPFGTIKRIEEKLGLIPAREVTMRAIQRALKQASVEFMKSHEPSLSIAT